MIEIKGVPERNRESEEDFGELTKGVRRKERRTWFEGTQPEVGWEASGQFTMMGR